MSKMGRPLAPYEERKKFGRYGNKVQLSVRVDEETYRLVRLCAETLEVTMADAVTYLVNRGSYYYGEE